MLCHLELSRALVLACVVVTTVLGCVRFEGDENTYACSSDRECLEDYVCFTGSPASAPVCIPSSEERLCAPGFADCDADPSVCEAEVGLDVLNCGACGEVCEANEFCEQGRCLTPCDATRCGDACVILTSSSEHCGVCGHACRGDEACVGGDCVCPEQNRVCSETCVDTRFDERHCGGCDRPCFENQRCETNACVCEDGFGDCTDAVPGCETDLSDVLSCGACGNDCEAAFAERFYADVACDAGTCALECWPGFGDCDGDPQNGCETHHESDVGNCRVCGNVCPDSGVCDAGICREQKWPVGLSGGDGFHCWWKRHTTTATLAVWCWGNNDWAQLGTGDTIPSFSPDPLPALLKSKRAVEVSAGAQSACVVTYDGEVWCWGYDLNTGLFGPGANPFEGEKNRSPVQIVGLTDVVHISAGEEHTCAVKQGGRVVCWGNSTSGRLGGLFTNLGAPVEVIGLDAVLSIRAGRAHTCALRRGGSVWCWGSNESGQLGTPAALDSSSLPLKVDLPENRLAIRIQSHSLARFTCAVLVDVETPEALEGEVWCWGANGRGQLGNGSTESSQTPVRVGALDDVSVIALGQQHSCVIRNTKRDIKCWGRGNEGQLGNGNFPDFKSRLVAVEPVLAENGNRYLAQLLGAGQHHTCAIYGSGRGELRCWGDNEFGQLGVDNETFGDKSASPVKPEWF